MAGTANISAMICNKDELAPTLVSLIISLIICSFAKPGIFPAIDLEESAWFTKCHVFAFSIYNKIKFLEQLQDKNSSSSGLFNT